MGRLAICEFVIGSLKFGVAQFDGFSDAGVIFSGLKYFWTGGIFNEAGVDVGSGLPF